MRTYLLRILLLAMLAFVITISALPAWGAVYKCTDGQGRIILQSAPCDDQPVAPTPAPTPAPSARRARPSVPDPDPEAQRQREEADRQHQQQEAAERAAQAKTAATQRNTPPSQASSPPAQSNVSEWESTCKSFGMNAKKAAIARDKGATYSQMLAAVRLVGLTQPNTLSRGIFEVLYSTMIKDLFERRWLTPERAQQEMEFVCMQSVSQGLSSR